MAETKSPRPAWLWPAVAAAGALIVASVLGVAATLIVLGLGGVVLGLLAFEGRRISGLSSGLAKAGALAAGLVLLVSGTATAAAPASPSARPFAAVVESVETPRATAKPSPARTPDVVVKEESVVEIIPFSASSVDDPNLDAGTTTVVTTGQNGERTVTYRVTYTDGAETSRSVARDVTTVEPIDEVTAIGTRQPPPAPVPFAAPGGGCHANYTGACVPIASDVDCEGGSGDGPAYVRGPVTVVGHDVYKLDRDGDGIACDK